jgi:hypothetical protein
VKISRKRLAAPVWVVMSVVGILAAPQAALADTTYSSIWNSVGWTPIPDPTTLDVAGLSACATQKPWTVTITLTNQGNGLAEYAALVKPAGKCAERFYGTKVTITDDAGAVEPAYTATGATSAYQWVSYGDLPPLVAPDSASPAGLAPSAARVAKIRIVIATTTGQNWWTCANSTWAAATGTRPVEVESDATTTPNCP